MQRLRAVLATAAATHVGEIVYFGQNESGENDAQRFYHEIWT